MGMDLYRVKDQTYFRWGRPYWIALLELAMRYGWQPMLESDPEMMNFGPIGRYGWNRGEIVIDEDAKSLAAALERALPDIPDEKAVVHKKAVDFQDVLKQEPPTMLLEVDKIHDLAKLLDAEILVGGVFKESVWDTMNCFEKLAGTQYKIRDFIKYLRGGAFQIW